MRFRFQAEQLLDLVEPGKLIRVRLAAHIKKLLNSLKDGTAHLRGRHQLGQGRQRTLTIEFHQEDLFLEDLAEPVQGDLLALPVLPADPAQHLEAPLVDRTPALADMDHDADQRFQAAALLDPRLDLFDPRPHQRLVGLVPDLLWTRLGTRPVQSDERLQDRRSIGVHEDCLGCGVAHVAPGIE